MVETTTKNYGWIKPEIQHSPATWGGFLNNDLDAIDALVFANQQGIAPIGGGALWFTPTPPANWLICDGSSLDTTAYATLFAAIGYRFGGSGANFNLPPLALRFPFGAGAGTALGATGGETTHTLIAAEVAPHTHTATQPAHAHTASQPAHTHGDQGHGHPATASQSPHAHGGVVTALTVPGPIAGGTGGNLLMGNTDTQQPAVSVSVGAGFANLAAAQPAITVAAASAGAITVAANTGGGAAHNNMPPWCGIYFIIRYQ